MSLLNLPGFLKIVMRQTVANAFKPRFLSTAERNLVCLSPRCDRKHLVGRKVKYLGQPFHIEQMKGLANAMLFRRALGYQMELLQSSEGRKTSCLIIHYFNE